MALELSARLNLPATYDGHYLALAERYDCVLWTGDQKLYRSVASGFARINWIGNRRDAGSPPAL
jgi:predicted nucleic acid-binding protein